MATLNYMPKLETIIEPTTYELINWFKNANSGDQCHVVTKQGQPYTHLTKVSPTMVKWMVFGFAGQDKGIVKTVRFEELLETWQDFA